MVDGDMYWRQQDLLPPSKWDNVIVTVIGVGGIGSPTTLLLAKMGCQQLILHDFDKVETHNLPNQMFPLWFEMDETSVCDSVGSPKTQVAQATIFQFCGEQTSVRTRGKFENEPLSQIVISAVDSMAVRKKIFDSVKEQQLIVDLFIDGRLGAMMHAVYAFDPKDEARSKYYQENCLYSDEEAVELPCTAKATMFNGFGIAANIGNNVKKYLMGEWYPFEVYQDYVTNTLLVKEDVKR